MGHAMSTSTPPERTPYAAQRKQAIMTQLRAIGRIDAADVAAQLRVTKETVRKDLIGLERQGLLRRVHGGAIPVEELSFEPAVSTRTYYSEEKTRIATAALAHLPARGSVLIDAGSTNARFAELFPADRELTVYTNTLSTALTLVNRPRLTVITLGGRIRPLTLAGVDDWAARALNEINVDVAFLGTNAISVERGLTTPDQAEAAIKRLMLASARRRILLADHSKIGAVSLCKHADLSDIDLLITDTGLPQAELRALQAAGLEVEQR
jgi:DeoR family fructose operon transcriptional repressor